LVAGLNGCLALFNAALDGELLAEVR